MADMETTENTQDTENTENTEHKKNGTAVLCGMGSVLFVAGLIAVSVWGFLTPDRRQSDTENRLLQSLPGLSWQVVADGSYMRELESYLTDQFPERDFIVRCKTYLDLLCGSRQLNGIYLGQDNQLFEPQTVPDAAQVETITGGIHQFCRSHPDAQKAVAIAPNATLLMKDQLPYGVTQYDQREVLSQLRDKIVGDDAPNTRWIDCPAALETVTDTRLYYRTDHHWTTRAAYAVFRDIAAQWELPADTVTYDFALVTDRFQGTLASSSGITHIYDDIEICMPHGFEGMSVIEYENENLKTTTFFNTQKLCGANAYEVFLGGNYAKLVIQNAVENNRTLLVLKDSYANCMIPMLAPYFSQIIVIDPRYFNDSVEGCMQDYGVTHVLFLYNLNTFLSDRSLADTIE